MGSTLWFFIQVHAAHALDIPHMHLTFRSSWGRVGSRRMQEDRAALFRGLTRGLLSIPLIPPKILSPPFPPLHVVGILAPFTQTWRRTARRHEGSSFARIPECQTSLLRPSGGGGGSKSRSRETRRLAVTSRPRPPQPGRPPRMRTRRLFLLAQKLPAAVSAATSRSQSPQRRRSSSRGDV